MNRYEYRRKTLLTLAEEYKYGVVSTNETTQSNSSEETSQGQRDSRELTSVVGDQSKFDQRILDSRIHNLMQENHKISEKAASLTSTKAMDGEKINPTSAAAAAATSSVGTWHSVVDQSLNSVSGEYGGSLEPSGDKRYDDEGPFPDTECIVPPGSSYSLPPGNVPPYRAVFLISNAALGAGLLNFPQAYMKAGGFKIAITVQLALLIPIIGSFLIIARCANKSQASTYQDMILFMLGSKFKMVVQVMIAVYFFGSAITYVIIVGEQLSSVIEFATGNTGTWYTNKKFLFTMYSLLLLLPLCIPRRLKALSYTSFFGGVGAFFITGVIITNYHDGKYQPNPKDPEYLTDWKSLFAAVPVICFGFQCHVSSVVVYAELKNRSMKRFLACACSAMVVCTLTYALSGTFGYKTFQKSTKADILENYADNDTVVNIARVSILFILLSSYAIVTFCARTVIDGFVVQICKLGISRAEETERLRRIAITICWFICVLTLAAVVPNIGVAIAMIGGIAGMFIFLFPGMCLLKSVDLSKPKLTRKDILLIIISGVYMVLGMFIFGEVTTLAINEDIKARHLQ